MSIEAACRDVVAVSYLAGFASGAILAIAYTYIVWRVARGWHSRKPAPPALVPTEPTT
jgi:hypothetical protein